MSDQNGRDERLGELLDRAVVDIRPEPRPDPIMRAGDRRRGARLVASVAVVVVFVAGLVWAATQTGTDHPTTPMGSATPPPTVYRDDRVGFSVTVPPGWQVAAEPLNTWVSDPHEILSMGTYTLRPGGHAVADFQLPSRVVEDMGPDDLFIWLNERTQPSRGLPDRPGTFSPQAFCEHGSENCVAGLG